MQCHFCTGKIHPIVIFFHVFSTLSAEQLCCDYDAGARCLNQCLFLVLSPFHIWRNSTMNPLADTEGEGADRLNGRGVMGTEGE